MKTKKKINKEMLIADLIESYPELGNILVEKYGFYCIGCPMSAQESIEEGAKVHGMSDKDVDQMIKGLRKKVEEDEK